MKTYLITLTAASLLFAGCGQKVERAAQKFNELPPAVQKTVRAHAPNAEIADAKTKTQDGQTVYEIEFAEAGKNPKLLVAQDGKILNSDLTTAKGAPGSLDRLLSGRGAVGTKLSALPKPVQKAVQQRAPNAEITNITRTEQDGVVTYEIQFKDKEQNPTLRIAEDGTVVERK